VRRFQKGEALKISGNHIVRVKRMKHILEVMHLKKEPTSLLKIRKLNKNEYVYLETGEVFEYNLSTNRADNQAGLKDTFRKIRDLINNNFVGAKNELHVTLTYAENMTDPKRLHSDFKKFWKKYKYRYPNAEYLSVVEPQGRGAWHVHALIRHDGEKSIFVPSDELAELWGQGFIKIKSLEGVDNIGAYLSAYLGDIELTDQTISRAVSQGLEIKEVDVGGLKKSFIKGGRLYLYPPGMNIYRHSKGITFPEVEKVPYKDIKKIVGNAAPNYSRTITILSDDDSELNQITYEQYNLKRKK
jgi:hypothetical protein